MTVDVSAFVGVGVGVSVDENKVVEVNEAVQVVDGVCVSVETYVIVFVGVCVGVSVGVDIVVEVHEAVRVIDGTSVGAAVKEVVGVKDGVCVDTPTVVAVWVLVSTGDDASGLVGDSPFFLQAIGRAAINTKMKTSVFFIDTRALK